MEENLTLSAQVKTAIIIPAYKEEEGLPIVLEKVFKIIEDSYEVIVVDDGSPDKTSEKPLPSPAS
jgi:Glycosyltransferases involved in cell wall biogenesis